MQQISSTLTSQEYEFTRLRDELRGYGFTLGGNWTYNRGSFDCVLDDAGQVWLRLPFDVIGGNLDDESDDAEARIRFGQPYVLKHVTDKGLNPEARTPGMVGAVFNQFSDPVNADAPIGRRWLEEAERRLRQIEAACSRL